VKTGDIRQRPAGSDGLPAAQPELAAELEERMQDYLTE
jgi:hypothetical protein